jgi:nitrogen fixation/metabolism regulation signal transduction histidine kinase
MEHWLDTFARANFLRSADTAHDLKTPLNVAVLNLELLRMRLRKLNGDDDEKIAGYTRSIETELRRMGRIFDAFFLLSTPPKGDDAPVSLDIAPIVTDAAASAGVSVETDGEAIVEAHEARIRQACKLFFEGASKFFTGDTPTAAATRGVHTYTIRIDGRPAEQGAELTRLFKFYYSDAEGNPDLSLAVARLIAETYGGELNAVEERDKVTFRLSFPLGAR